MEIKSAEFTISSSRADMCPKSDIPEYAFIGRSNVGKSSLINMLTKKIQPHQYADKETQACHDIIHSW